MYTKEQKCSSCSGLFVEWEGRPIFWVPILFLRQYARQGGDNRESFPLARFKGFDVSGACALGEEQVLNPETCWPCEIKWAMKKVMLTGILHILNQLCTLLSTHGHKSSPWRLNSITQAVCLSIVW